MFVGENGIFPGEQFLKAVATGQVSHDFMTSEVHDVRVYGDVAIVIARVRNRGEFEGNPFTLDEWSSDVFVRRGDRWRCSVTHLTLVAAATQPRSRSGRAGLVGRQNSRVSEVLRQWMFPPSRRLRIVARRRHPRATATRGDGAHALAPGLPDELDEGTDPRPVRTDLDERNAMLKER